ncbi:MAG: right-handed parallel beta-helix repeat-containing protein [Planctomycetota bacterium]
MISGDLNGDDVFYLGNIVDNSQHLITLTGVQNVVIDGFTLRGGYTTGSTSQVGGAIRALSSQFTVRGCRFDSNVAKFGGAIGLEVASTAVVEDCVFAYNEVRYGHGGAIEVGGGSGIQIHRCEFRQNRATGGSLVGRGGAIDVAPLGTILVEDSLFRNNLAEFGCCGGVGPSEGGAVSIRGTGAVLRGCRFLGNEAHDGGGISVRGQATIENSIFSGNRGLAELGQGGFGGAMLVRGGGAGLVATACTIYGNLSHFGSAGLFVEPGNSALADSCVLWGNIDLRGGVGISQIENGTPVNCCVQNMLVAPAGMPAPDPSVFATCFDQDPQFLDPNGADGIQGNEDDDFRLAATSPCIDAGSQNTGLVGLDLDGALRCLDGDLDGVRILDVGACEYANVRLEVARQVMPDGSVKLTASLDSTDAFPLFLSVGLQRAANVNIDPWGEWFVDWSSPYLLYFMGYGDVVGPDLILPANYPVLDVSFQAIAIAGTGVGNFSNPVLMQVP